MKNNSKLTEKTITRPKKLMKLSMVKSKTKLQRTRKTNKNEKGDQMLYYI